MAACSRDQPAAPENGRITENSAPGTFQFTAEPVANTGASGTKVVTQGVFAV